MTPIAKYQEKHCRPNKTVKEVTVFRPRKRPGE
ncbi:unnamed protein product [Brugia pahangi]|uniref:50S ribosomal protein L33 n=1 Tax=Brugia pahangi TaxID=6280 RepID=A0A158PQ36_BRUPA|nr:unnamed protein product [Brugia pahangi]